MTSSKLGRFTIFVGVLMAGAIIAICATMMWRAGWFDAPTSLERYAREQNRIVRRQVFSWVLNVLIVIVGLAMGYAAIMGAVFMRAKVARAGDIRAKGGMLPVVRQVRTVWVQYPGEILPRRVAVNTYMDLNKIPTGIVSVGDHEDPEFYAPEQISAGTLSVTLGAQTVQRQAAASGGDGPITIVDDDPVTDDIKAVPERAPLPGAELISSGHISRLLESSEGD